MVYCKKCARLLDEDVRFCPYCNHEDENFVAGEDDVLDKIKFIDEQIAQNTTTPEAPVVLPPGSPDTTAGASAPYSGYSGVPNSTPPRTQAEYVDPRSVTVETARAPYGVPYPGDPDEKPPTSLYIGLVVLSVVMTLPGFIAGIVYMTHKKAAYRKMGLVVLLVSIGMTLFYIFACCVLVYGFSASELLY